MKSSSLPFPSGVFAVAQSSEVKRENLKAVRLAGKDLVVFRTKEGKVSVLDAYCPHLGAHLPSGGKVNGERIQCPFHGLKFDVFGNCKSKNKEGILDCYKIKSYPSFEKYGFIFVQYGTKNIPDLPDLDFASWSKPTWSKFSLNTHIQELSENAVDELHFSHVHDYVGASCIQPVQANATEFKVGYSLKRENFSIRHLDRKLMTIELLIHNYGLGVVLVNNFIPEKNLKVLILIFQTQVDENQADIRIATLVLLRNKTVVRKLAASLTNKILKRWLLHDFKCDFKVWENKIYIQNPNYLQRDGNFAAFREWTRNFY